MAEVLRENPGPACEAVWPRNRFFVGFHNVRTDGTVTHVQNTVFPCRYVPTESTHGHLYGYVRGPFRQLIGNGGAYEAAGMSPGWVIQQYWGRAYGWEDVDAWNGTRREALERMRTYQENQPEIPVRVRRSYS